MVFRIALDPGHGGKHRGACYGGIIEADRNMATVTAVLDSLAGTDYICRLTRFGDEEVSLKDRNWRLREFDPDIVFSIHHNANPSTTVHGFECYHWPGNNRARIVAIHAADHVPLPLRSGKIFDVDASGIGTRSWLERPRAVVGAFDAPCVLFECGYLTNTGDSEYLARQHSTQEIATTIRAAIVRASAVYKRG